MKKMGYKQIQGPQILKKNPTFEVPERKMLNEVGRENFFLIRYSSFLLKTHYTLWPISSPMSISIYLKNIFWSLSAQMAWLYRTERMKVAVVSEKLGCNLKDCFSVVLETEVVMFGICTIVYFYPNSDLLLFLQPRHMTVLLDMHNPLKIRFDLGHLS